MTSMISRMFKLGADAAKIAMGIPVAPELMHAAVTPSLPAQQHAMLAALERKAPVGGPKIKRPIGQQGETALNNLAQLQGAV